MNPIALSAIAMLVLLFLNVPVFAAILGGCIAYFLANPASGITGVLAIQRVISGMQSTAMLAIPFFVCAGALMNYCGITERMMIFCKVLTQHIYGGLGHVSVVVNMIFAGMSGSSVAAIASIRREMGSGWAAGVVLWQCTVAWIFAFLTRLICLAAGL